MVKPSPLHLVGKLPPMTRSRSSSLKARGISVLQQELWKPSHLCNIRSGLVLRGVYTMALADADKRHARADKRPRPWEEDEEVEGPTRVAAGLAKRSWSARRRERRAEHEKKDIPAAQSAWVWPVGWERHRSEDEEVEVEVESEDDCGKWDLND